MAHRLNHLNKRQAHYPKEQQSPTHNKGANYQQQPGSYNNNQESVPYEGYTQQRNGKQSVDSNNSTNLPRPIFPPSDQTIIFQKNGFRKGLATFPAPQQIFESDNNYDAGPHFIRPTSIMLHSNPKKTVFPIGAWISPFGSEIVHTVDVHSPLRCSRCKAYVNPYFVFAGSRKVVTCNICGMNFSVDQSIDKTNIENTQILTKGVVDFRVKDKFYFRKRTDIIKIVVCIEMSQPMIEMGVFNTIIESLKSSIENTEFQSKIKISIVHYNEEGVVFSKIKKSQNWAQCQPTQYVVKVTENSTFCCPLSDQEHLIDPINEKDKLLYLLDCIAARGQAYYQKGKHSNTANYVAAIKCLKDSFQTETGRIMLFSCLDPRHGKSSIRTRSQQQSKQPLKPLHNEFYALSKQLLKSRIGVEHYIFTKDNMICHQLATTHFLSSQTGGTTHFYPGYIHENHSEHLYYTVYKSIAKAFAYDLDYTCRVSNGLNISSFCTANGVKEVRDVGLGCMDPQYSLGVLFEHEQKIEQSYGAYIQFAMMYTNGNGQRRVRTINFRYLISQKLDNMYDSVDYLAFSNIMSRMYTTKLFNASDPRKIRDELITKLSNILAQYRFKCSNIGGKYSELSAPQNLKKGLAYLHSIVNSKLFMNPLKITPDSRIAQILRINTYGFYAFAQRYYPKLYPLTMDIYESQPVPGDYVELAEGEQQTEQQIAILPENIPLTRKAFAENGVYLQDNGDFLTLLIPAGADQQLLTEIFGTTDYQTIEADGLPELEGSHNIRINIIVSQLRRRNSANNGIYLPLLVKTPMKKGPFGQIVNNVLKEDYFECNYYSFLDAVHRTVQAQGK